MYQINRYEVIAYPNSRSAAALPIKIRPHHPLPTYGSLSMQMIPLNFRHHQIIGYSFDRFSGSLIS